MRKYRHVPDQPSGVLYRLVQALTGTLVLVCLVCGFLGLRAIVWQHDAELSAMLTSGLTISLAIGTVLSVLYLIFGVRALRFVLRFHWMNVQLGLVVGMLLYGIYNAFFALLPSYAQINPALRGLQGAIDGALIGALVGGLIGIISAQPVHLTRAGIVRFLMLFLLVLLVVTISILVGNQPRIPRNVSIWLLIPLILLLRLIVGVYDRRMAVRKPAEPVHSPYDGHYNDEDIDL